MNALNTWMKQADFDDELATGLRPVTPGYGPKTAKAVAAFQLWLNKSGGVDYPTPPPGPLKVDGIAGTDTLTWLAPWSPNGRIG